MDLNQLYPDFFKPRKDPSEMTREERKSEIYRALLFAEIQIVDPEMASWFEQARKTTDVERYMRVDLAYINRIFELQKQRKMRDSQYVLAIADDLSSIEDFRELGMELVRYQKELIPKKE